MAPASEAETTPNARTNWLRQYHPEIAAGLLSAPPYRIESEFSAAEALIYDSQLQPTIGIPAELFPSILSLMSPELRGFLELRFVFGICGLCFHDESAIRDFSGSVAMKRYLQAHFDGSEALASRDERWPDAKRLAAKIDAEMLRLRLTGS